MSMPNLFLLRLSLLVLFSVCLVRLTNCDYLNLTSIEEIELHSLYKSYNKAAVQEIKTTYGDTYSCVHFHKQPTFDNPLLKNHVYRLEKNLHERSSNVSQEIPLFKGLWANGEGCPTGTVPIRKYTKEQFTVMHRLFQKLHPADDPVPGRYRSSVHTTNGPFHGGAVFLNIYNFPIDRSQYTSSFMSVRAGEVQLQFGYMINPTLYGDDKSRLFLTTTIGNVKCFNLVCGGFVHTNKNIPLDAAILRTTQRGADHSSEMEIKIYKEGNVWKLVGANNIEVGYWPSEVSDGLKGLANYLEWGGEAYNPNGLNGPGMGSGFFPTGDPRNDGYARSIAYYDKDGKWYNVLGYETRTKVDDRNLYYVKDAGIIGGVFDHIVMFGGPGKK